jgi:LmbE family N-acetylglucosaminyl deacetylase
MKKNRILAVFAHPDDEAFGTGGSLAYYALTGQEVYLVCATRGEVGEISDPGLATPETLGQVREGELRCSAETVGIKELTILGYRDSGMLGSPENQDPRALINAPADQVVRQLVGIIRKLQPHIVLTFEPNGGYGHPDHIAIHHHCVDAFHAAADVAEYPELGPTWQSERLFFTVIPRSYFLEMRRQLEARGEDMTDFNAFENPALAWPDEQVNLVLDVSATVEAKWEALNCHRTQFGPGNLFRRLPDEQVKLIMSKEYFAQAWPIPKPGLRIESLLSGI